MYNFDNSYYVFEHQKNPRGIGCWYFADAKEQYGVWVDEHKPYMFSEAKKIATQRLKEMGCPEYKTIYVMP